MASNMRSGMSLKIFLIDAYAEGFEAGYKQKKQTYPKTANPFVREAYEQGYNTGQNIADLDRKDKR